MIAAAVECVRAVGGEVPLSQVEPSKKVRLRIRTILERMGNAAPLRLRCIGTPGRRGPGNAWVVRLA